MNASPSSRWWDWLTLLLLYLTLSSAAGRLTATHWTEHLELVHLLALTGLVLGCGLGYSRFGRRMVWGLGVSYSAILIPWQVGRTLLPDMLWKDRLPLLGERSRLTLTALLEGRPVEDPLFFLTLMAMLFFGLAVNAGYYATRHNDPWRGALPPLLAALVIELYDPYLTSRSLLLALTALFFLLTLTRMQLLRRQRQWKTAHTRLPPFFGLDMLRMAAGTAALTVLLAWNAPRLAHAFDPAAQTWKHLTAPLQHLQDDLADALAAAGQSVGVVRDYYSDELPLGRGLPLDDAPVLLIQAERAPGAGERFYWRARTFNTYRQGRWLNTLTTTPQAISPERPNLPHHPTDARRLETFLITPQQPLITLYAPEQPVAIGHTGLAHLYHAPDGSTEVTFIQASRPLRVGEAYQATAALTSVTEADLRAAGTDYPSWVTAHYLQLPPDLPDRIRTLAQHITAGLDTPYDKAQAITAYLRRTIRYRDTIPEAPAGREPIDWFLFDLQAGFCNYYATAEVLLLRAVGIPAQVAVGYAQGEVRDAARTTYLVRQRDAHTWPEVYFPGIGWVEFEPTVSQAPLVRPSGEAPQAAGNTGPLPPLPTVTPESPRAERLPEDAGDLPAGAAPPASALRRWLPWLLPAFALLLAFYGVYWQQRQRTALPSPTLWLEAQARRYHLPLPKPVQRRAWLLRHGVPAQAYHEINRALERLGVSPAAHLTPAERAALLQRQLPEAAELVQPILQAYQTQSYGPIAPPHEDLPARARRLRRLVWKQRWLRWLARFQEPDRS